MFDFIKKYLISAAFISLNVWLLSVPALVRAQQQSELGNAQLRNPLKSKSLTGFFNSILEVIMVFAVPLIVFFIIYAGFLYVTAQGNETTISKAHKALLYAVVGGLIILGAKIILEVISGTISAF